MGTSGNPAKKAQQLKVSQVGDFKKRLGGVFELPSGLVMKLRNPGGLMAFMASGLIPNELMSIMQKHINSGKNTTPDELMKDTGRLDEKFLAQMTAMLDNVIVTCAVEPSVMPKPDNEEERSDDQLYADEIPDDDKMFVFQWISGGTSDLATFRQRQESGMASLEAESVDGGNSR